MITIIDYQLGNLFSVQKAFEALGFPVRVSGDPHDLATSTHIVLPGVGAFPHGMRNLEKAGFLPVLEEEVRGKGKPFLGICLGLQLIAQRGYEHEECAGLGWISGEVRKLDAPAQGFKIPHIGWNDLSYPKSSRLFDGIPPQSDFYFVHSYALTGNAEDVVASVEYGGEITAAVERDNIYAVQFHPEKSQEKGLQLLSNFMHHA
jgi:glutamine amidotransferase